MLSIFRMTSVFLTFHDIFVSFLFLQFVSFYLNISSRFFLFRYHCLHLLFIFISCFDSRSIVFAYWCLFLLLCACIFLFCLFWVFLFSFLIYLFLYFFTLFQIYPIQLSNWDMKKPVGFDWLNEFIQPRHSLLDEFFKFFSDLLCSN